MEDEMDGACGTWERNSCSIFVGILKARDQLEDLGVDGSTLKLILKK
jgi:hypothetical protein